LTSYLSSPSTSVSGGGGAGKWPGIGSGRAIESLTTGEGVCQGTLALIATACGICGNALNKGVCSEPGTWKCSWQSHVKTSYIRYIYQGLQQILSADCDTFGLAVIRWG
jgi:hypothetical protein